VRSENLFMRHHMVRTGPWFKTVGAL
jgi:hypothetical protein